MTWSVTESPRVAQQRDVSIQSTEKSALNRDFLAQLKQPHPYAIAVFLEFICRIRVWGHRSERLLICCVMYRHTGSAPGIMVWSGIGFHCLTRLVRALHLIAGATSLNSWSPWSSHTFSACHIPTG
ncbi:hypothetical protein TNCV_4142001 [Trichonephila clavipes]|nr:hypothetical protein TNCV_4142001 [Trichonephila clavipes]